MWTIATELGEREGGGHDRAEASVRGRHLFGVVADGVGGQRSGGAAAAEIVRRLVAWWGGREDVPRADEIVARLTELDIEIHDADALGMATAVVLVGDETSVWGASAGDSGALLVRDAEVDELTRAQRTGQIGSGRAEPATFGPVTHDGLVVVATDGLLKFIPHSVLGTIVRAKEPEAAARGLLDAVEAPSGDLPDDVALIVARFSS